MGYRGWVWGSGTGIGVATEVLGVRVGVSVQGVRAGSWTGSGVEWILDDQDIGWEWFGAPDIGSIWILDGFGYWMGLGIGAAWKLDGYWDLQRLL